MYLPKFAAYLDKGVKEADDAYAKELTDSTKGNWVQ